jgi:hypothetical protein
MKKLLFSLIMIGFSLVLHAQLELNSTGQVGMSGLTPNTTYGLRVGGKIYSNNSIYGTSFGASGSAFHGSSLKLYGGSGETNWNTMLTSNEPGKLHINGSIILTSDERLKKDKKRIEGASVLLSGISGHTYYFKPPAELVSLSIMGKRTYEMDTLLVDGKLVAVDPAKQKFAFPSSKQYGFMAQEVMQIMPDLVHYDSASGAYGVDYISFIPLLVEANKELLTKQEAYESRLLALEKQVEKLTKKNSVSAREAETQAALEVTSLELFQNNPNPFNQQTEIRFSLSDVTKEAHLYIYDMQGRQVKSIVISERGAASIILQAESLEAGMYLYTLIADGQEVGTKKMILTK